MKDGRLLACLPRLFLAPPVAASFGPPADAANKSTKAQPAFSPSAWLDKVGINTDQDVGQYFHAAKSIL